jgi:tRNA threonylcarbamoyladenosine modification (KEOPS) complex  Pcc1 subunit
MKVTAEVFVHTVQIDALKKCFDAELTSMQTLRSTVAVHNTKEAMQFSVTATDATAMRATLNSITKLLAVFEKASQNE